MVIMMCLRWWYGAGWQWAWRRSVTKRVAWYMSAFSIAALVRTWFSPFKQTYNSASKGSLDMRVQATIDNFVSRVIGSIARSVIIFAGLICIIFAFVSGVIIYAVWPLLPFVPVLAVIFTAAGATI